MMESKDTPSPRLFLSPPLPFSLCRWRTVGLVCLGLVLLVQTGCSRAYWRRNANAEAYGLIQEKTRLDGRWVVPRTDIIPSPLSRMYDPFNPDYGPLPPDDPAAHRYMQAMSDCQRIEGSEYWSKIGTSNRIENPAWIASLPIGSESHVPPTVPPLARAAKPGEQTKEELEPLPFLERFAVTEMWRESSLGKMFQADDEHDLLREPRSTGHFVVLESESAESPSAVMVAESSNADPEMNLPARITVKTAGSGETDAKDDSVELAAYQEPLAAPDASPDEPIERPGAAEAPDPFAEVAPADDGEEGLMVPDEQLSETIDEAEEARSAAAESDLDAANPALPEVEKLTLEGAVALSYLHGRQYQFAIEDVYIAALDLAFDRFQFDVRFLGIGGNRPSAGLGYEGTPDGSQALTSDASVGMSRLLPAGGQWAVELMNQTLWLFSDGPNESGTASTLTFSFIQPLLFAAGRKVVLEGLTQSERDLLYAVRDLARFRQIFFVQTVTGGGSGGFLGLLQSIQQISNQEGNIRRIENQLEIAEANVNIDALSRTQLESTLLNALNRIRQSRANLQNDLDQFKIQLGLPPDLPVSLDTSFLEPFGLIADELFSLESGLEAEFLAEWANVDPGDASPAGLRRSVEVLDRFARRIEEETFTIIEEDFQRVRENLPRRLADLPEPVAENRTRLAENRERDRALYENAQELLREQMAILDALKGRIDELSAPDSDLEEGASAEARRLAYNDVFSIYDRLLRLARNLQGIQIGLRTELIALNPFEMPMTVAVGFALTNRVDLMNQRAIVTDARRKVEVAANALRGVLDLRVEQQFSTRPIFNSDNPLDFRRTSGTFRAGVSFVAPLSQIGQRNEYRIAQITYQRTRRDYMLAEDQVKFDVRQAWRQLRVLQQNFEVARQAVRVAAQQYDQAVEEAADPEQQAGRGGQSGLNVINALNAVLGAQNDLIGIWVQYESARLNIYRDMGIMDIDARGMWVDPFYQNGMMRPAGDVEGPPGWNGSTESPPALLPNPGEIVPIPPAPPANSGVRMNGGASALSRVFEANSLNPSEILPASYLPGRDSHAAAQSIPPKNAEAGHVRSRRSFADVSPN